MDVEASTSENLPNARWEGLIDGDYDRAVIRIATLAHEKINYLLFASVELLPPEVPSPPKAGLSKNCGEDRFYFTRDVLPTADALAWYEGCQMNNPQKHPTANTTVLLGSMAPEPPVRRFVLRDDIPFSPVWHGIPRIHRLVDMDERATPIAELLANMVRLKRYKSVREWLFQQLHFDILAHDDWLGCVGLIAPNPLFGSSNIRISSRSGDAETVTVTARPRRGARLDGVKVVFEERRVSGAGYRAEVAVDPFGIASAAIAGGVVEVGHQIICGKRGLLHDAAPGWFFRSIITQTNFPVGSRVANPLRRRRSGASEPLTNPVWSASPPIAGSGPVSAVMRLEQLQRLRLDRFGEFRPLRVQKDDAGFRLFGPEREEALLFIRRLITRARRRVFLVDPYLVAADLQEFAYAAEQQGVAIAALISPPPRYYSGIGETDAQMTKGDELTSEINSMRQPSSGFGDIDIRVTIKRGVHDRFLCIDDELWHCGHSFNGVGTGDVSAMSRVPRPAEPLALLDGIFAAGVPFETWWANRPPRPAPTLRQNIASLLRTVAAKIEGPSPNRKPDDTND